MKNPMPAKTMPQPNHALVIDDNAMARNTLQQFISMLGYHVLEAEDGVEGITAFREHEPSIAFLVVDVEMPKMNGIHTLQELVCINPDVKVIMATGNYREDVRQKIKSIKDVIVLSKPFSFEQFSETVKIVMG
ncbi:MAG: response regulator [Fibrobacterota bacterium]